MLKRNKLRSPIDDRLIKATLAIIISLAIKTQQQQQVRQLQEDVNFDSLTQYSQTCRQLKFVSRDEWGAKSAVPEGANLESFVYPPQRVIVHQAWDGRTCNDIDSCSIRLQAIQAFHQHTKYWPDISYNFLISGDGTVYEGLGFKKVGFHTLNYNQNSLGIALIGTFQDVLPPKAMLWALEQLIKCSLDSYLLAPNYTLHGHRDARCTICPGDAAYSRVATMARFRPGPLARYTCPKSQQVYPQPVYGSDSAPARREESEERIPEELLPEEVAPAPEEEPVRSTSGRQKVVNVNSHNRLVSLALNAPIKQAQLNVQHNTFPQTHSSLLEETFVGVVRRRQEGAGPVRAEEGAPRRRQAHSLRDKAAINKRGDELLVVSMQPTGGATVAALKPSMYLLTNGKSPQPPIVLLGNAGGGGGAPSTTPSRPAASTTTARPAATTRPPAPAATTRQPAGPASTTSRPAGANPAGTAGRPAGASPAVPPPPTTARPTTSGQTGSLSAQTSVGALLDTILSMSFLGNITLF